MLNQHLSPIWEKLKVTSKLTLCTNVKVARGHKRRTFEKKLLKTTCANVTEGTESKHGCEFPIKARRLMFLCVTVQSELERVEEEQTFQELQSLRQIVYDWFQKEEEIAEVVILKSSTIKPAECL